MNTGENVYGSDPVPPAAPQGVGEPPEPPEPGFWGRIDEFFWWLVAYPAYKILLVLIVIISSGGVGADLGFEHLFWHEYVSIQVQVGVAVGLLIGTTLYILFLLNRPTRLIGWLDRHGLTLFPGSADPVMRQLGGWLLFGMVVFLLTLLAPKVYAASTAPAEDWSPPEWTGTRGYLNQRAWLWPFVLGYGIAVLFVRGMYRFDESRKPHPLRERLLDRYLFGTTLRSRLEDRSVPKEEHGVHGVALYLFGIGVTIVSGQLVLVAIYDTLGNGLSVFSPIQLVAMPLTLVSLVFGVVTFYFRRQLLLLVGLAVLPVCCNSTACFPEGAYKLRFDGLDEGDRTVLWEPGSTKDVGAVLTATREYADHTLIPSEEPLANMSERWQKAHNGQKPKVIIVCTSGGGVRAAVWTGVVLQKLEQDQQLPQFRDNIRMITGASGGMVGATLYAADFERNDWGEKHIDTLAMDSLARTAQSFVLRDMVWNTLFVPPNKAASWDRGRTLQWKWGLNAKELLGRNPFDCTFAELRPLERDGLRPSLVYSPMMVEDARRLLVSNLNVEDLTTASGPGTGSDLTTPPRPGAVPDRQLTRSAVEFHRLFPDMPKDQFQQRFLVPRAGAESVTEAVVRIATSDKFTVGTAARMNATFPVISPAVSLPTAPVRRLVDAGIYDNYGVNLAAEWALKHQDALRLHTSGVAIVQIRAYPLQKARNQFAELDPDTAELKAKASRGDLLSDLLSAVAAPAEAVLNARANAAQFRNAELIDELTRVLNTGPLNTLAKDQFFCTVWLELHRPAALNWYITRVERDVIKSAYGHDDVKQQVKALREWYGAGGR